MKRISRHIWFLILVIFCFGSFNCAPAPRPGAGPSLPQILRIGLTQGMTQVQIEFEKSCEIRNSRESIVLKEKKGSVLFKRNGRFIVGSIPGRNTLIRSPEPVKFLPTGRNSLIEYRGNTYLGEFEISLDKLGGLLVVNLVNMQDYLTGVVSSEIGKLPMDLIEAVKAQAIIARTYTLAHFGRRKDQGFDLEASLADQMYKGYDPDNQVAAKAAAQTENLVIVYNGTLVEPYYFSTCGGYTADVQDVWEGDAKPYLKSIKDADDGKIFCQASPHFRWRVTWDYGQIVEILNRFLAYELRDPRKVQIKRLEDLYIEEKSPSGRVKSLRIEADGSKYQVKKDSIRRVLRKPESGFPILPSLLFTIEVHRSSSGQIDRIVASGSGNGHGVGMCQWGAIGMARTGYSAEEIVKHYFKGTEVRRVRSIKIIAELPGGPRF